jgi:hypothetical protein
MGNPLLDKAWAQAEAHANTSVDIGEIVVCDFCNEDYTDSSAVGGMLFGSYATCPKCAVRMMPQIERDNETGHIRKVCPDGQTFKAFVLELRGGNNTITIFTGERQ